MPEAFLREVERGGSPSSAGSRGGAGYFQGTFLALVSPSGGREDFHNFPSQTHGQAGHFLRITKTFALNGAPRCPAARAWFRQCLPSVPTAAVTAGRDPAQHVQPRPPCWGQGGAGPSARPARWVVRSEDGRVGRWRGSRRPADRCPVTPAQTPKLRAHRGLAWPCCTVTVPDGKRGLRPACKPVPPASPEKVARSSDEALDLCTRACRHINLIDDEDKHAESERVGESRTALPVRLPNEK